MFQISSTTNKCHLVDYIIFSYLFYGCNFHSLFRHYNVAGDSVLVTQQFFKRNYAVQIDIICSSGIFWFIACRTYRRRSIHWCYLNGIDCFFSCGCTKIAKPPNKPNALTTVSSEYCYSTKVATVFYFPELFTKYRVRGRMQAVETFNQTNRWKKKGIAVTPMKYGFVLINNKHILEKNL